MEQVTMTAEERQEYEAFRAEKARKEAAERRKQQRADYTALVDQEVQAAVAELRALSEQIRTVKETVFSNFETILKMKDEAMNLTKSGQRSHHFTSSGGMYRLSFGMHVIDGYSDLVDDGIAMVRSYIESLAKDETSKALVNAVLRLLSRDQKGNIKASRVLQLQKMAEETGDERFIEGVNIIREAYRPTETKRYIRAEYRGERGEWITIPLSITEAP